MLNVSNYWWSNKLKAFCPVLNSGMRLLRRCIVFPVMLNDGEYCMALFEIKPSFLRYRIVR